MSDLMQVFQFGEPRPHIIREIRAGVSDEQIKLAEVIEAAELEDARSRFKNLPEPTGRFPYRLRLREVIGHAQEGTILNAGKLVFHSVGDTGQRGHGALAQERVALHMEDQLEDPATHATNSTPAFFFHLGDVIYYNGELEHYPEQFYEPYRFYRAPILAIPGNHDGDSPQRHQSLSPFVQNFCTHSAEEPPMPGLSRRRTMTQPHVYFTLEAPFVTIIGLYSNVTGHLDRPRNREQPQLDWLVGEMRAAAQDRFLVLAVHHPPFSADNYHGPQGAIGEAIDRAIEESGRLPHLVLAAHVHNFQYFKRTKDQGRVQGDIQYVTAGAGGYAGYDSLHRVLRNDPTPGATLQGYNDTLPGFLRLEATATRLKWEYFTTPQESDLGAETLLQRDNRLALAPPVFGANPVDAEYFTAWIDKTW